MNERPDFQPNWDDSDSWNEFEWEQALKYSDHLAARYFRMLERFGDLPDGEELIVAKLGDQNFFEFEDPEPPDEDEPGDWDEEFAEDRPGEHGDEPNGDIDVVGPGDSLYFETVPVYQRARQISLGWCNILASVLSEDDRFWGMKILFGFGRVLSYLAISIGDGRYDRVNGSVAFAKRAVHQLNAILGELREKKAACPKYETMFDLIREHLLETHDMLVGYLQDLRERQESGLA